MRTIRWYAPSISLVFAVLLVWTIGSAMAQQAPSGQPGSSPYQSTPGPEGPQGTRGPEGPAGSPGAPGSPGSPGVPSPDAAPGETASPAPTIFGMSQTTAFIVGAILVLVIILGIVAVSRSGGERTSH